MAGSVPNGSFLALISVALLTVGCVSQVAPTQRIHAISGSEAVEIIAVEQVSSGVVQLLITPHLEFRAV